MKNIYLALLLISTSLFAQNYDKKWSKVIEFEGSGKIKSANSVIDEIYKKAIRKKDEVQIIKCFFYKSKYMQTLEENAQSKILANLKHEINQVSIPSQSILNLVYAKCLNDYLHKNHYIIYNRTQIDSNTIGDFLTWAKKDFEKEIQKTYEKTIANEAVLKNTPLLNYEPIFDFFTLENFKEKNIFDYALKENITFYASKINQWEIYPNDFKDLKNSLLGSSNDFSALNFDSVKNEYLKKVLTLYQKQEAHNPSVENQLERIRFCSTYILKSDDDFLKSLNSIQKKTRDEMLLQRIQLEKITIYSKLASKQIHPDYNIKALSVLDSIISVNNRSNAYKIALAKKAEIITKSIYIQLQKYIYTQENTRAFVNYKNVENLTVSFYKINQKTLKNFESSPYKKDSLLTVVIANNQAVKTILHQLLNKKDYFDYSTEIVLPQLETGSYLVYFESNGHNTIEKAFAYETITVSNFTVLANTKDKKEYFYVLDRKTGKPIKDVVLKSALFNLKTDKDGLAIYAKKDDNHGYSIIELSKEKDTIQITKNYIDNYEYYNEEKDDFKARVEFYLDRAIYRPGQTVYYKGIVVQKKQNKNSVVPNLLVKITIEDANNNDFKEFEVTTNEYGSFSGEFVLPKNGLTGDFTIIADEPYDIEKDSLYDKKEDKHPFWDNVDFNYSTISFKVEEYKRPKFEVVFDPNKETNLVNQKINTKGSAKAFAGSILSDARVTYTVTRHILNDYSKVYNYEEPEIITTGETKTDAYGKFNIEFMARPSEKIRKEDLPVFSYKIAVNVTDINGETRSSETIVKAGYRSLLVKAIVPNKIQTKDKNVIQLFSTNLNDEFVATKGEIKIYFIREYQNKFKPRVWEKPEIESISETDFNKLFPYEMNETPLTGNETGTLVYTQKVNTQKNKSIPFPFISNYKSGYYKLVFSTNDTFNNPIESSCTFQLIQSNNLSNSNKIFTIEQLNNDPKKDGFVALKLTSIIPELSILTTGNYKRKVFFEQNITLSNNQITIKIPFGKEFTSTIKIGFQGIFENQDFNDAIEVFLKTEQPKMQFEVESIRNKIEPGSLENWSFKLLQSNPIKEAEVLASMYDSSLDQFTKGDWYNLDFYEYQNNYSNYKTSLGFEKTNSYIKNLNIPFDQLEQNNEDTQLIWFGFDFNNIGTYFKQREYQKQITKKSKKPLNAKMISGIISDVTGPLPGANVVIKGTTRGVQTDIDGYYEIEAASGEVLMFSFVGMNETTKIVGDLKNINVTMEDGVQLGEVVVTGALGIKKRVNQQTSSTKLAKEKEMQAGEQTVIQGLIGKVSGLQINTDNRGTRIVISGSGSITGNNQALVVIDGVISSASILGQLSANDVLNVSILKGAQGLALYGEQGANGVLIVTTKKALQELTQVKARTNLSEMAFFYPNLKTDSKGKISFSFTSPEALTSWKFRLFAHNKNAVSGYLEKSIVTQKDVMVIPNFPRFLREKDTIVITTKISNVTNEAKTGIAVLQLFDASTMQSVDTKMLNTSNIKNYSVAAYGNTTVSWKIYIPEGLQGIQYKVLAKSGNFSDGEENILPVLTNTILVTESIPIWVRENSKKEYIFENLKTNTSATLRNHQLTLEYTSNPTWLAIQSLPYLMEYEHECAEQTFARFYANAIASEIINSNPKIAEVFETWRKNGKLNSKLDQNEELKSIILSETPWLNDAQNEEEKKKNLALLFDLEKMKASQEATFEKLKQKQKPSGGFAWFDGSDENEYITRHILAGFGHLKKLSVKSIQKEKIDEIVKKGIPFMDGKFLENHHRRMKNIKDKNKLVWLNPYSDLHYLYTRSFYLEENPLSDNLKNIIKSYLEQAKGNWLKYSLYEKGLAALVLHRFGEMTTSKKIMESIKETAANNKDWGMYWIENKAGWYWHQAPIETQALLIEAFAEINNDNKSVDAMKVWLLKNKQNKNWPTTKATTEAIYALLMQGNDWLSIKDNTVIKIGDEKIATKKLSENEKESETGYLKLTWNTDEIKKEMATLSVENKSKVPGFGGFYWQYFEDLDKIKTNSENVLTVAKELYIKKNAGKGEELQKITSNNPLKIGDLITVRLIISAKEDMEYVHLKDMRASCFEPLNVLSEYKWNDGVGYYMSTKDAAIHFFFDTINKGTYVIEYDIRVNNTGDFSNGITTIQSMYAPEFTSHTKGIRVKIKE